MARTKSEYQAPVALDMTEADGMREVSVTFTLQSERKDAKDKDGNPLPDLPEQKYTDTFLVPKNGAGIKAFQKAVNEAKIEGVDGNSVICDAILAATADQRKAEILAAHKEGKPLPTAPVFVPDYSLPRIVDPNEAKAEAVKQAILSGKIDLSSPDIAALFGKLGAK